MSEVFNLSETPTTQVTSGTGFFRNTSTTNRGGRRPNFTAEEDMNILQEVYAVGTHVHPFG